MGLRKELRQATLTDWAFATAVVLTGVLIVVIVNILSPAAASVSQWFVLGALYLSVRWYRKRRSRS